MIFAGDGEANQHSDHQPHAQFNWSKVYDQFLKVSCVKASQIAQIPFWTILDPSLLDALKEILIWYDFHWFSMVFYRLGKREKTAWLSFFSSIRIVQYLSCYNSYIIHPLVI